MSLLLAFSILFNFYFAKYLSSIDITSKRLRMVTYGVICNLLLLGYFKYTLFLLGFFEDLTHFFGSSISIWKPEILLPVGISFYTFHNISYLVEIFKRQIQPSENLITFSVYDIFFPLLLAGPIERPNSLLPQLEHPRTISIHTFMQGISLFVWGIFLKTVIADPLAKFVDLGLSQGDSLAQGMLWWIMPSFAFQVYADFSGYSNCARGLACMMGFRLMNNFHRPFFATNPSAFWQRWHISLSSWLRDYVYIPLGGNRKGFLFQNINIMIVWILGGLWHGATYGYLIWGIYLGACIILFNLIQKFNIIPTTIKPISSGVGLLLTFFSFSFGLLLFRVEHFSDLAFYLKNLGGYSEEAQSYSFVILYFIPVIVFDLWQAKWKTTGVEFKISKYPWIFFVCFAILFLVFALIAPFAKQEFFYFQF